MTTNNKTISNNELQFIREKVVRKYDEMDDARHGQLTDIKLVKSAIYNNNIPSVNEWNTKIQLPDIYELAQTLKAHISENLYSHPDSMFDVSGKTPQTQLLANRQKAMLVNTFEEMHLEEEMEKKAKTILIVEL